MAKYQSRKGKIVSFAGSWGSGIATLTLKTSRGIEQIYCDNGPTGRALGAMFGAIAPGHCIDNKAIEGKTVYFCMDDMGLCLGGLSTERF